MISYTLQRPFPKMSHFFHTFCHINNTPRLNGSPFRDHPKFPLPQRERVRVRGQNRNSRTVIHYHPHLFPPSSRGRKNRISGKALFKKCPDHASDGLETPRICGKPADFGVGLKPGDLPLGIPAGVSFNEANSLLKTKAPKEISKDMPVPERLHRFQSWAISLLQKGTDFIDPAQLHHSIDAEFNPSVQIFSLAA